MSNTYKIIIGVVLVLVVLIAGYYIWQTQNFAGQDTGVNNSNTIGNNNTDNNTNTTVSGNTLDLSGQQLAKIPDSVFSQTNLEVLDVSGNALTGAIQAEIRKLANLKILDASDNLMTGVPAEIGQLQKLEVLDLSNNQLTGLPNELGNLENLKTLNLSGNNYSEQDLNYIKGKLPATVNIIL